MPTLSRVESKIVINGRVENPSKNNENKMVKIRLQRHGKKGKPFYKIVVANSTDKRDGRFIEEVGTYNPNTNPATIVLDLDKAVAWLEKGAQPTLTTSRILSYKGALLKKHLNGGVLKGAFTQEVADAKFAEWLKAKEEKVSGKVQGLEKSKTEKKSAAVAAEAEVNARRTEALAAKAAAAAAAKAQAEAVVAETEETEAPVEAVEAPAEEAPAADVAAEEKAPQE